MRLFAETALGTEMTDSVRHVLPGGPAGDVAHAMIVRRQLSEIFTCRAGAISKILEGSRASGQEVIPAQ